MKKIAIYIPSLRGGGAERIMVILANEFAQRGFLVDLVLVDATGPYLSDVSESVQVIDLKSSRVLFSFPKLVRYLKSEKPDALLSALGHANVVAVWSKFFSFIKTNLVISERNHYSSSQKNNKNKSIFNFFIRRLFSFTYKKSNAIVAISHGVAADLSKELSIDINDITVVHNPIDIAGVAKLSGSGGISLFQAKDHTTKIVGIGRLVEQKRFDDLISAFAIVRKKLDSHLYILGDGPLLEQLKSHAQDLGDDSQVSFVGFVKNPFPILRNADLFVFSSGWEGFGNALVEAMACGTPVVSTDCPSGPDEILENGKWGRLVPVGNVEALAKAMLDTLTETEHPDVASRAAFFSVERAADEYLRLLLPDLNQ